MIKRFTVLTLAALLAAGLFVCALPANVSSASDEVEEEELIIGASPELVETSSDLPGFTLIYTYEDMMKMREDPSGNYQLMNDIDFSGKTWEPFDFSGVFDGCGFAVLNCRIDSITTDTRTTYDGNMVSYDTAFAGFFGIVENAEIRNFSLYGLDVDIHTDRDCFAGGMAGYTDESVIKNCTISGTVSMYINAHQIGTGGAVGFGNGEIINCTIDTTQILVDENVEDKDEQFMGGVNANGYMSITCCDVTIRGYDSDHGYVHDGGLSGMFIVYPEDNYHYGYITNNRVSGFITFFEDNVDRRAYCWRGIGEDMSETYDAYGNEYDFEADERFEYDTVLLPHTCENPTYTETEASGICPEYGHKIYTCDLCGYTYNADYTPSVHTPIGMDTLIQALEGYDGLEAGKCALCGITIYEKTEYEPVTLPETTTEAGTEPSSGTETAAPETETTQVVIPTGKNMTARIIVIALIAILVVLIVLIIVFSIKRKRERERLRRQKAERRRSKKNITGSNE